jgi:hypothetical protein
VLLSCAACIRPNIIYRHKNHHQLSSALNRQNSPESCRYRPLNSVQHLHPIPHISDFHSSRPLRKTALITSNIGLCASCSAAATERGLLPSAEVCSGCAPAANNSFAIVTWAN